MNISKQLMLLAAIVMPVGLTVGCTSGDQVTENEEHGHDHDDHEGHDHSHEHGPNGGHLLSLGEDHEYHVEWDHDDDTKTVIMYVLDKDHENNVPIAAEFITVTFTAEGESRDYQVAAVREDGAETTAKFESTDADLFALISSDEAEGMVKVEIEGQTYEGELEHGHHH